MALEPRKHGRVNARKDYETSEPVDKDEDERIDESLAEFFNLEDVFDCLNKLLHILLHFHCLSTGSLDFCDCGL